MTCSFSASCVFVLLKQYNGKSELQSALTVLDPYLYRAGYTATAAEIKRRV